MLSDILNLHSSNLYNDGVFCRYTEIVLPLLEKVKVHLAELRPLTLRLEVLEDIFSALFSQASDFDNVSIGEPPATSTVGILVRSSCDECKNHIIGSVSL